MTNPEATNPEATNPEATNNPAPPTPPPDPDPVVGASGRASLNEDWAATVVGLVLLVLVLTGLLPGWLVP